MAGIAALALAYIMSQFYRSFLAVLTPVLAVDPGVTPSDMSAALGAWFVAFALAQFVVGPMLDSIGPKRTAAWLHLGGGAGGAALFAVATAPWMVIAAMAAIGVGCAPVLMATFYLFRKMYSPARLAVLSAWFIVVGNTGNLAGTVPLAWLVEAFDWRSVMWGLALVSVAISLATLVLVKDPERDGRLGAGGSYMALLRMRVLWPILPLTALSYSVIANMRGLWAGPYFNAVHGYDAAQIGTVTFAVACAMITGTFLYGPLDTLLNTRKWVIIGGSAIMVCGVVLWALDPVASPLRVTILLMVIGATGASYPVIMAHGLAFIPDNMTGRGATLLNFFSIGGTGVMQWVSGGVFTATAVEGDPVSGFSAVLWLYAICSASALALYMLARDAKPNG